ncbi:MAG: hypothetical protein KAY46_08795 [Burkholderiaceae bacterium]|nr:hypothetical protein [Burkholderiaceae bacterium]
MAALTRAFRRMRRGILTRRNRRRLTARADAAPASPDAVPKDSHAAPANPAASANKQTGRQ